MKIQKVNLEGKIDDYIICDLMEFNAVNNYFDMECKEIKAVGDFCYCYDYKTCEYYKNYRREK